MSTYRALIVDDEPQVRHTTARALSPLGFYCELACDGRDALELVQHTKYDLVVTDLKMPDVNGHKLAIALLNLEPRPIISVLTGVEEPKLAKDLSTRGVERIYYKPVDYKEFATELFALVEKRGASYAEMANGSLFEHDETGGAESLPKQSASQLGSDQQVCEPRMNAVDLDQTKVAASNSKDQCLPRASAPNNCDATNKSGMIAISEWVGQANSGMQISNSFAIKIDAELLRTKKALLELQRAVTAGQNQSYFCLAIALGAGLIGGLVLGWLSSQLFSPTSAFK